MINFNDISCYANEQQQDVDHTVSTFNYAPHVTVKNIVVSQMTVEAAFVSAGKMYFEPRNKILPKRARILLRLQHILEEHADAICQLVPKEHCKVLSEALGELRDIENMSYLPDFLRVKHHKNTGSIIDCLGEIQVLDDLSSNLYVR